VTSTVPLIDRVRAALGQDFEILRLLGQGGMATVYLARERALKRLVAIKVLDPDLAASPLFRNRFQREAETAAQLQHASIVPIYRVGEAESLAYFTMAFIDGESLADRVRGLGRLPGREARRIATQVAEALGAAHRRGIIHRDVKPQNVLLDRETGRAMVTDFGIASARAGRDQDDDRLTSAGMVMGTPRYMSPEQASGVRDLTPASDLYALGVVLYEMLSGEYPYRLGDPPNYLIAHVSAAPIPLVSRVGDVSREMETTVNRLLAKDPGDRFATADAVVDGLEGAGISGSGTVPVRPVSRRRRGLAVALGLAVMIGVGLLATRGRTEAPAGIEARKSILIGFFDNTTQDPSLDWLRVGGVDLMGQALSRWQDLTVVDAERLLDLTRREGLDRESRLGQEDVLRLARMAGVWTATVGQVFRGRDSLVFTVKGYDVAKGDQVLVARAAVADSGDIQEAFRQLAAQVLEVAGAPSTALRDVEPPTRSLAAYRAYIEGIQARSRWRLDSAALAFRRAVTEDPTFALAYYELSQALAWTERTSPQPSYVGYADSALRYATGRPPREARVLEGYHALMHADIPRARELYTALTRTDTLNADVWGWRGVASQIDLTLRRDASGKEFLPADWTGALRDYNRALELDASDHRTYLNLAGILSRQAAASRPSPSVCRPVGTRRSSAATRLPWCRQSRSRCAFRHACWTRSGSMRGTAPGPPSGAGSRLPRMRGRPTSCWRNWPMTSAAGTKRSVRSARQIHWAPSRRSRYRCSA
jgi:serine/threonine-protein kinase